MQGIGIEVRDGIGRRFGVSGFAKGAVKYRVFRQNVAALIGIGISCKGCNLQGFAVRFLQAHNIRIGQLDGFDDICKVHLIAAIPDVKGQNL